MTKPRFDVIAIDVDDVLVPHADHLIGFLNEVLDAEIDLDRFFSFDDMTRMSGRSEEEIITQARRFLNSAQFTGLEPVKEAVEVIARLKDHYDLVIVTARPLLVEETTRGWLEKHFPATFASAHFVNLAWEWGRGHAASKMDVCRRCGVTILIDDSSFHIEEAVRSGMRGLLFGDYAWNQEVPEGAVRVKGWHAVAELLL